MITAQHYGVCMFNKKLKIKYNLTNLFNQRSRVSLSSLNILFF